MRNEMQAVNFLLKNKISVNVLKLFLGVVVLFAGAQISIPTQPVPITFHTVALTLIAFLYTPRLATTTILTYLLAGVVGFPVFSKFNSGTQYMLGATGGYMLGFLIATPIMSILVRMLPKGFFGFMASSLIGHIIIYIFGVSWLSCIIGFEKAFYSGFVVFIPTGIIKLIVLSYLLSYILGNNKNV